MAGISVDELSDLISQEIEMYSEEVEDSINKACDMVSKELMQNIREDSPAGQGDYKKGWARKKLKYSRVVYNKNKPWLTHLLEHGHAKRGGGRVKGTEHIKKNADRAIEKFEDLCVDIISEGLRL